MYNITPKLLESTSSNSTDLQNTLDGVQGMSKIINEYGVVVVVMAIFFIIFLLLVFLILRNNSKMMNQMVKHQNRSEKLEEDLLAKLVDSALNLKVGEGKNKDLKDQITDGVKEAIKPIQQTVDNINAEYDMEEKVHKDLVGNYIDINMAFKDASRLVMNTLKCSRVAIYVFHNGNRSMLGLPFFKMSCIHEWTNTGSNTLRGKSHVDMPLHVFTDFVEDLWKNGIYKSNDIKKSELSDPSIVEFVNYSKTNSLYMVSVKDIDDKLSGFVVSEFENVEDFDNEFRDNEVRSILTKMAARIAPILDYRNNYSSK